jgi:hypothetical protein
MPLTLLLGSIVVCLRQSRLIYLVALILIAIFAVHNAFRVPFSDWAWYARHYVFILENGVQPYLSLADRPHSELQTLMGVRPAATEPVMYVYMYAVGKIVGSNIALFGAITATIFYTSLSAASLIISKSLRLSNTATATVLVFTLTLAPNYALVLHLVRQELASAFIMIAIALHFSGRSWWAVALSVLAVLTHNSAAIPVAAFASASVLVRYTKSPFVHIPAYAAAGLALIYLMSSSGRVDLIKDDGDIGILTYALDVSILAAYAACLTVTRLAGGRMMMIDYVIAYGAAFYGVLLALVSPIDLLFLRLYFYSDVIAFAMFARTVSLLDIRRLVPAYAPIGVLALGTTYILLSLARSPLPFAVPISEVALWPLAW